MTGGRGKSEQAPYRALGAGSGEQDIGVEKNTHRSVRLFVQDGCQLSLGLLEFTHALIAV